MRDNYKLKYLETFLDVIKTLLYVVIIFIALKLGREDYIEIINDYQKQKAITELAITQNNVKINFETEVITKARILYYTLKNIDLKITEEFPIDNKDMSDLSGKLSSIVASLYDLIPYQYKSTESKLIFKLLQDISLIETELNPKDTKGNIKILKRNCIYLQSKLSELIYILSPN